MKTTILYFSETGNTERMAKVVGEGIRKAIPDVELRYMNLKNENDLDIDFINECKTVVFGTPTYVANMCWQLKRFFDERFDCPLGGKLGAVFATANSPHGGADVAILGVINHMLVRGMLAYSSGSERGRPFIHLGPIALMDTYEERTPIFELFGERIGEKTLELFGGKNEKTTMG